MGHDIIAQGDYSVGIRLDWQYPKWNVSTANVMAIMGGNVGIGTVSPQATLHVNDTLLLEPRTSAPSNPTAGMIYCNSTTNKLMGHN